MSTGQEEYYLELSTKEDYYLKRDVEGEPPGRWLGSVANTLRLGRNVEAGQLRNLLRGLAPDGSSSLVQEQHYKADDLRKGRKPGWDLTYSVPKTLSAFYSQSSSSVREQIDDAIHEAVSAVTAVMEQNFAFSRRGRAGVNLEPCKVLVAAFPHLTSRAKQPNLHVHCLLVNLAERSGSFGTLRSKDVYEAKMALGALFRAELAHQLQVRLGLNLERKRSWFELRGVSIALCDAFSTRRKEIEAVLAREGSQGAKAAERAALFTRSKKTKSRRSELFAAWQELGREHGFSWIEAEALLARPKGHAHKQAQQLVRKATIGAADRITEHEAHFTPREVLRHVAEELQTEAIPASTLVDTVMTTLRDDPAIVSLGRARDYEHFSTRKMYELESKLLEAADRSRSRNACLVSSRNLKRALAATPTIRNDQADAVRRITTAQGQVQLVEGIAGTGKTFMLGAARGAFEREGYRVIGTTLSAKAARELEKGSGIRALTLRQLQFRMNLPLGYRFKHHAKQLLRAALSSRKQTYSLPSLSLDSKTVLVVDEAGMVGTRVLGTLFDEAERTGAKLVLVGDPQQLQPISAGGPFRALAKRLGAARLGQVVRQKEQWMRDASLDFGRGRTREGLVAYAKRDRVHVADTRLDAMGELLTDWHKAFRADPKETFIFTATRKDASTMNALAQEKRLASGELRQDEAVRYDQGLLYAGDRVLIKRVDRLLGIDNGDRGTIERVSGVLGKRVRIKLDRPDSQGKAIRVTLRGRDIPEFVTAGYSGTTHKGQGETLDMTFVLAGGSMQDAHLTYVQCTRHRSDCHLYLSKDEAGEALVELIRAAERERPKILAREQEETLRRQQEQVPAYDLRQS